MFVWALSRFSGARLFAIPRTAARQSPLSLRFSRQEYWSGLPCPPQGNLPDSEIEPASLSTPALTGRFFTTSTKLSAASAISVPNCVPQHFHSTPANFLLPESASLWLEDIFFRTGKVFSVLACSRPEVPSLVPPEDGKNHQKLSTTDSQSLVYPSPRWGIILGFSFTLLPEFPCRTKFKLSTMVVSLISFLSLAALPFLWWWFSCYVMTNSLWPHGLPGFSVHGISQGRVLEWVAISFSRASSWSRDWTCVSCIAGGLYCWATGIPFFPESLPYSSVDANFTIRINYLHLNLRISLWETKPRHQVKAVFSNPRGLIWITSCLSIPLVRIIELSYRPLCPDNCKEAGLIDPPDLPKLMFGSSVYTTRAQMEKSTILSTHSSSHSGMLLESFLCKKDGQRS